jgi:hypothetical protein
MQEVEDGLKPLTKMPLQHENFTLFNPVPKYYEHQQTNLETASRTGKSCPTRRQNRQCKQVQIRQLHDHESQYLKTRDALLEIVIVDLMTRRSVTGQIMYTHCKRADRKSKELRAITHRENPQDTKPIMHCRPNFFPRPNSDHPRPDTR